MRINIDRVRNNKLSKAKLNDYFQKYTKELKKLKRKGVVIEKMTKSQLAETIQSVRQEFAKKGRYSPRMISTIIDAQRYVGGMSFKEASAFKRALGLKEKVRDIRSMDREQIIAEHGAEISNFWKSIRGNQELIDYYNQEFGTDYSVRDAHLIISNYFFGSK